LLSPRGARVCGCAHIGGQRAAHGFRGDRVTGGAMAPMSLIPTEISTCFKDAHSALTALEQAVEGLLVGSESQAATKFKSASDELEAQRDEAVMKVRRLEEDMERKRDRIASLEEQVDEAEDESKRKDHEISRLEAIVEKLRRHGDSASPRNRRSTGSAIALRVPSRSRERRKVPRRSRSRRGRQRSDESSRRGRRGSGGSSSSGRGSSSRDSSQGSQHRSAEGDTLTGSWVDRRPGGESRDSALCIPFIMGNCRAGDNCKQRHPGDEDVREAREALRRKPCRFGASCHRGGCIFRHDGRKEVRDSCRATPCRYGSSCKRPDCKFLHSWDSKPVWREGGDAGPPGAANKPCRYGSECKRPDCAFKHP